MQTVTTYISAKSAAAVIDFCTKVFGAQEIMRHADATGLIRHAQIQIGDSTIMLSDENPAFPDMRGVESYGGSPISLFINVDDADATAARAVEAGAKILYPIRDQVYGRSGSIQDPFGILWHITKA
jgi:PhnB protein